MMMLLYLVSPGQVPWEVNLIFGASGKGFTMGYAMLGIPISMVMFQSMGERMNKAFIIIIKTFRKWRGMRRIEVSEFDLILASGITSSIVVSFGAVLFHTQEGWSFFDSLYYCFITLSTIGFGDYVALQSGSVLQVIYQVLRCKTLLRIADVRCALAFLSMRQTLLSRISINKPPPKAGLQNQRIFAGVCQWSGLEDKL